MLNIEYLRHIAFFYKIYHYDAIMYFFCFVFKSSFTNSISFQPDQCTSPVRLGACPDGQRDTMGANSIQRGPTLNHVDSVARTFFIDVGRSSIVAYRFRFPVLRGDTVVKAVIQ